MKKHKSKKALLFIFLFLFIFNGIFIFGTSAFAKSITITFPFKLPWMESDTITFNGSTKPIAELVVGIYNWAIGVVGILAAVAMMLGGLMWVMAGGSAEKVGTAKSMITGALTGLILTLTSFMVLNSINPDLTRFRNIVIGSPKVLKPPDITRYGTMNAEGNFGCCLTNDNCYNTTEPLCTARYAGSYSIGSCSADKKLCVDQNGQDVNDTAQLSANGCCLWKNNNTPSKNWTHCKDGVIRTQCKISLFHGMSNSMTIFNLNTSCGVDKNTGYRNCF